MKRNKKSALAFLLCLSLVFSLLLTGCGPSVQARDLMSGVAPQTVSAQTPSTGEESAAITDFSLRLFRQSTPQGENALLSPLSVLYALAMAANGARGETLIQMEQTLSLSVETLNQTLYAYRDALPQGDKARLSLANSIWLRDTPSLTVEPSFLQTNTDYYGAAVFSAPFDDSTVRDINRWVKEETEGMIPEILEEISPDTVAYLINALSFDGEWETVYKKEQIQTGPFTMEDGTVRQVELMYSSEHQYLEDENVSGFLKYYAGGDYAFAALLPREGLSVADYLSTLTGESLSTLLANPVETTVYAAIPKFELDDELELKGALSAMGMTDLFDPGLADLSGLGSSDSGNLYIDSVLHKTTITVDEKGTRAGAVTSLAVNDSAAPLQPKTVYLDRPFVFLLVDCRAQLPLFLGTVMDPES